MSDRMREYASPVSSTPFKYTTEDFWVEVEGQRFNRHDPSSLYDLLTYVDPGPAYTKKGKLRVHQPIPHKDKTQSFYVAQLYHYGLRPRKTKQAAKNALLAAFKNQGSTLTVPENIRKIEKELADKYRAKNAMAEGEYRRTRNRQEEAKITEPRKRKREEEPALTGVLDQASGTTTSSQKKSKPSRVSYQICVVSKGCELNLAIAAIATFRHTQSCLRIHRHRTRSL